MRVIYPSQLTVSDLSPSDIGTDRLARMAVDEALRRYEERETKITPKVMRQAERLLALSVMDNKWRNHLSDLDNLRMGIAGVAQADPLTEHQRQSDILFTDMVASIKHNTARCVYHIKVKWVIGFHGGVMVARSFQFGLPAYRSARIR